jgi:DNA sulfur modification protein DndD
MQIGKSAETLYQAYTVQRLNMENEKQEYLALVEQKNNLLETKLSLETRLQDALQYSVINRELYDNLKTGLNQDTNIKNRIEQIQAQIDNIYKKEKIFHVELDEFLKDMELNVCVPKLIESVKTEVNLILKTKSDQEQQQNSHLAPEQIEAISKSIVQYLSDNKLVSKVVTVAELVDFVISKQGKTAKMDHYDFLEFSEIKALESMLNLRTVNSFPSINQQQTELNISLSQIQTYEVQIEQMKQQITGRDYILLKAFEDNEAAIKQFEIQIAEIKGEISKLDKRLHQYDIQTNQEPDPRYEALGKLKGFFEDVANRLLKIKKQQIELKMKQDLNINLSAYHDVIERVELSENLKDLTFKIYHKAGNEIYLSQLNTASKQVVIQVLLKSLHEFGDYDPPVMIDTVMGVLDETSRAIVLENYFPDLSQQTILLSSDSEIRIGRDLEKIKPFISKTYTLHRDKEKQLTAVTQGYFGVNIND